MASMLGYRAWRGMYLLSALLAAFGWGFSIHAATTTTPPVDPPNRVARVAYVAGDVGLLPAGATQWQQVGVNRPLTTGDRLATSADARLALEFGDAALRLAGSTDFGFADLGDWQTRGALTQGTLALSVRTLPDGEDYEIDTPQVAVVVDRPARIRVDLGDAGTTVTVRNGSAVVHGDDGARQVVEAGERYRFADSTLRSPVAMSMAAADDAFHRWSRSRDVLYADNSSGQYVSADTVGYRDLDRYGRWQAEVDYGEVWFPNHVDAGWAPYRDGRWASIAPWGWTWISNQPWGFAPFHYGRWHQFGGRWGWVPGPAGVRAVYAPAVVGFIGGAGWQVSVGVGVGVTHVGWYPLGPGVVYNPWYRVSRRYYRHINHYRHHRHGHHRHGGHGHHRHWRKHVDHAWNVWRKPRRLRHKHYLGPHTPSGVTVVARKVLAHGGDVHKAKRLHVKAPALRHAPRRHHGPRVSAATAKGRLLQASARRHLPVKAFARPVVARRGHVHGVSGPHRSGHTPWKSPVRLLAHGRAGHATHAHRGAHQGASSARHRAKHAVSVHTPAHRGHAARKLVSHRAPVRVRTRHARKAPPATDARHLPRVPRLRAGSRLGPHAVTTHESHAGSHGSRSRHAVSTHARKLPSRRSPVVSSGHVGNPRHPRSSRKASSRVSTARSRMHRARQASTARSRMHASPHRSSVSTHRRQSHRPASMKVHRTTRPTPRRMRTHSKPAARRPVMRARPARPHVARPARVRHAAGSHASHHRASHGSHGHHATSGKHHARRRKH